MRKENYWEDKQLSGMAKEQSAQIRSGSVEIGGKKGVKYTKCRACKYETKDLNHILICEMARK